MFKYALISQAVTTPVARATCSDVTVVFARGTFEAAPIGTIVGPPFKVALQVALPGTSLNFIGVDYPADLTSFEAGGSTVGSKTWRRMSQLKRVFAQMPKSSFLDICAQLVHKGSALLSTEANAAQATSLLFLKSNPNGIEDPSRTS
ncbi:carbohydrate esterase family 5 protein [Sphaerobolus stellatus SS14]|uniref:cutinase n=1 Tax=Sphaerobolus stellatus (strain SS14) TaxID=990650 RepID=A0A0C9W3R1_SPHS4|nr:carbohydrate esterase family 5 protein [Sphaerobolus stellatus SS14]KIJ46722.1 carbohydrate esterase family 5 protein [Sphaerobolus stellatus SS14]